MKVNEIFRSISGEIGGVPQGAWTTFIRFQGCDLKCSWCDTKHAQDPNKGKELGIQEIMERVIQLGVPHVLLTGGEPLQQDMFCLRDLLEELKYYKVSMETNGSIKLPNLLWGTVDHIIMDYKLSSAGVVVLNNLENVMQLGPNDVVKFVVDSWLDVNEAGSVIEKIRQVAKKDRPKIALSPTEKTESILFNWMEEHKMFDCVLSIQLHKILKVA